jgi:hypothetical protein
MSLLDESLARSLEAVKRDLETGTRAVTESGGRQAH